MIYRARTVVTMGGPPIDDGAVAVVGARIPAVGRYAEIGGGLINAHCHLDFTALRGKIAAPRSFADWIRQINGLRRELSEEDYLSSIAAGLDEARRWGTTTIANIESMPQLLARVAQPPLRVWWFLELIDVRSDAEPTELVARSLALGKSVAHLGLSLHAPYMVAGRSSISCRRSVGHGRLRGGAHPARRAARPPAAR